MIIACVEDKHYDEAASKIEKYINTHKQVTVYVDPEVRELKLELKALELQISTLEDEKTELDRFLRAFQFRHAVELGELLRKILIMRREKLQQEAEKDPGKKEKYKEAHKDYEEFERGYKTSYENEVFPLWPEEQQELKTLFRACSKLCHPDVVAEEYTREATDIFHKLTEAYEKNDLTAVKEIYVNLENRPFTSSSDILDDIQRLLRQVIQMRARVTELSKSIANLRDSEAIRKVTAIGNWDDYFCNTRRQLEEELEQLERM